MFRGNVPRANRVQANDLRRRFTQRQFQNAIIPERHTILLNVSEHVVTKRLYSLVVKVMRLPIARPTKQTTDVTDNTDALRIDRSRCLRCFIREIRVIRGQSLITAILALSGKQLRQEPLQQAQLR